jgi:hypothetical protein
MSFNTSSPGLLRLLLAAEVLEDAGEDLRLAGQRDQ